MTLTRDIIKQAAFAKGKILHAGTGKPIVGTIHITAKEGPVIAKVLEDGTFALSGDLDFLFPELSSRGYALNLNIRAVSAQFRLGYAELKSPVTVTIPAGQNFDPETATQVPDDLIDIETINGTIRLPDHPTNYLRDIPVNIQGRVVNAADTNDPINNATIEVLQSGTVTASTSTDNEGRYSFKNIVVIAPAQIKCSATSFVTQTRPLLIDFTKMTNEEYFRLVPVP